MRISIAFFLLFQSIYFTGQSQIPVGEQQVLSRLKPGSVLPEGLLRTRSVVFYPYTMAMKDLDEIQKGLQRTGIDAVVYIESDFLAAGRDPSVALAEYLNSREISHILIFQKENGYSLHIAAYNNLATLFDVDTPAWFRTERTLDVLLQTLFRMANSSLKRENLLINDYPELAMPLNIFKGRRSDFFAIDLKVDPLSVPKYGDEGMDRELAEIVKGYPFEYKLTEAGLSEAQIRQGGSYYVLRYVYARDKAAQQLLGYNVTKSQSAIVSVTYPENSTPHLKNISADTPVYKFYFKHIDSGNIFLGTKWDADVTWQQALINQLRAFKAELKIN
ncbi:MAG TPA: hypothetical protein VFI14_10280 [Chryseosolibacter sp.]|nr:hypothetical protein [Chryseosolibacter sp.]